MHLFEFMDQSWVPGSLRATLRDILECGNSWPFRNYYDWICATVLRMAAEFNCDTIVELGAGTAPVIRRLSVASGAKSLKLVPCDANPDIQLYRQLENAAPNQVMPIYGPVDFSELQEWPERSLLVLSATLHHIPSKDRLRVVDSLRASGRPVLVFEPLRNNTSSILFTLLSLFPALCTPLRYFNRPENSRRFVWCWLAPLAPPMFVWDGIVSCLRQWSAQGWRRRLSATGDPRLKWIVGTTTFCQLVLLDCGCPSEAQVARGLPPTKTAGV